jgi:hypothetical protein
MINLNKEVWLVRELNVKNVLQFETEERLILIYETKNINEKIFKSCPIITFVLITFMLSSIFSDYSYWKT